MAQHLRLIDRKITRLGVAGSRLRDAVTAQRRSFLIWDAEIPSHHPKSTVRAKGSDTPVFQEIGAGHAGCARYFSPIF